MDSAKTAPLSFCADCGRLRLRDVTDKLGRLFKEKSIKPNVCGICKEKVVLLTKSQKSYELSSGVSRSKKRKRKRTSSKSNHDDDVEVKQEDGIDDTQGSGGNGECDDDISADDKPILEQASKYTTRLKTGALKTTHYQKSSNESDGAVSDNDYDRGGDFDTDDSQGTEPLDSEPTEIKVKAEDSLRLKCEHCSYTCQSQRNLRKHGKTHSQIESGGHFECEKCQHVFKNKKVFDKHVSKNKCQTPKQQQPKQRKSDSGTCSSAPTDVAEIDFYKLTKWLDQRIVGWLDKPSTLGAPFKCKYCKSKEFKKLYRFLEHMTKDHPELEIPVIKRPIVCDQCGFTFPNRGGLNKHLVSHLDGRPFVCDHAGCGKAFKAQKYLRGHQDHMHGVRQSMCSICGGRFVNSYRLHLHETRVHQGVRLYKCQHCGKAYATSEYRNRHERLIHLKERPWVCEVCGRSYQDKKQMMIHGRTHTGEKPYACDHCDYRCIRHDYLAKHIRIHGKKPLHPCTHCDLTFKLRSKLTAHEKKHHADLIAIPFPRTPPRVEDSAPVSAPLTTTTTSTSSSSVQTCSSLPLPKNVGNEEHNPEVQVPVSSPSITPTTTQFPLSPNLPSPKDLGYETLDPSEVPVLAHITPTTTRSFETDPNRPLPKGLGNETHIPPPSGQAPVPVSCYSSLTTTQTPTTSFQSSSNPPLSKDLGNERHNPSYKNDDLMIFEAL